MYLTTENNLYFLNVANIWFDNFWTFYLLQVNLNNKDYTHTHIDIYIYTYIQTHIKLLYKIIVQWLFDRNNIFEQYLSMNTIFKQKGSEHRKVKYNKSASCH